MVRSPAFLHEKTLSVPSSKLPLSLILALALGACATDDIVEDGGVVITRSACPAVAIPASTGDITTFDPPTSRDARAIDVVAYVTNVRSTCSDTGDRIVTTATYEVRGQRRDGAAARSVVLPVFTTMVQGGVNIVAKRTDRVALNFAAGAVRASTTGTSSSEVARAATTLPADVRAKLTRRRKSGDLDAAVDPMTDPAVRTAVNRASFEMLVGFQLTDAQLGYNATR